MTDFEEVEVKVKLPVPVAANDVELAETAIEALVRKEDADVVEPL